MKTVSEILKTCKLGDILIAGRRKWKVTDMDYDGNVVVARPDNKLTKFELWSEGIESVAAIPGLKKRRK